MNALLKSVYQSRFAFANSSLSLSNIIQFFDKYHRFKLPDHTTRDPDLSIRGDFELANVDLLRKHFVEEKRMNYLTGTPTPPALWLSEVAKLNELTKKIQDRGGKVILIRLPTSDGHWQLDETFYPKAKYWDLLAEQSLAPAIHFPEIDGLSDFYLPDTSHLDFRDRESFSATLFDGLPREVIRGSDKY